MSLIFVTLPLLAALGRVSEAEQPTPRRQRPNERRSGPREKAAGELQGERGQQLPLNTPNTGDEGN